MSDRKVTARNASPPRLASRRYHSPFLAMTPRLSALARTTALALLATTLPSQGGNANFETPPVHGLELSADALRLYAVQPAAGRLVVFSLQTPERPVRIDAIPVGLEPVSVRLRTPDEAWVVNRLSDSISIVSLPRGQVVANLPTADEPADVVFAGTPRRAFVTAAGAGVVQVFDPDTRREVTRLPLLGDEPTALATDATGTRVFVGVHRSGNGTTLVPTRLAPPQPPPRNPRLAPGPPVSLIVRADDPQWRASHGVDLADLDVAEIDADRLTVRRTISGVGTMLFGLAYDAARDTLWVANTEALNTIRLEPELRGRFVRHRVTRVDLAPPVSPTVTPVDLNPGVDYDLLPNPGASARALAQPTALAPTVDGTGLWVAAFGTDRVALLDAAGHVLHRVSVGPGGTTPDPRTKRGPRCLALHPTAPCLYVSAWLSGSLVVIDTHNRRAVTEVGLGPEPMPTTWREGRGYLYDALLSGNGLTSCATCHVDGRRDGLAWDIGDPWGEIRELTRQQHPPITFELHPMKGPLLTQTLQGLDGQEPFHWRGDRSSLGEFNSLFDTLLGGSELDPADLQLFLSYLTTISFHPNPNQNPDRTHTDTPVGESARDGAHFFATANFSGMPEGRTCMSCHVRPSGSSDEIVAGRETAQYMITPPLRTVYQRRGLRPVSGRSASGYGLLHDGEMAGVFEFLSSDLPFLGDLRSQDANKRMLERFLFEFDTGTAPAVGRTLTVTRGHPRDRSVRDELALLEGQVIAGNCGLVAHTWTDGERRAWAWEPTSARFLADASGDPSRSVEDLLRHAHEDAPVTLTAVPPGGERRHSIDRDGDGVLDRDQRPERFGRPTPPCAVPLQLDGNDPATLGNPDFALIVRGAPTDQLGVVLLGARAAAVRIGDLRLLVDPHVVLGLTVSADRRGVAALALPLPAEGGLAGQEAYAQAFFPAACARLGVAASNGLRVTLRP